ncbi:DNA repair protein SWI5 homolog [Caloenas nicobarica]
MSAPRPGHVSRGGERRRRPPGSAPARPALLPGRPGPSASPAAARVTGCFGAAHARSCDALRCCAHRALLCAAVRTVRCSGWGDYPPRRAPRRRRDYNSQRAPRGATTTPSVPRGAAGAGCRREAAALAEGVLPSAGRSPPRQPPPPPRPLPRRAPGGGRRSGAAGFKSPVPSPRSCQPNGANEEALLCEIKELKQKDLALDQEITQLLSEGYSLEELEKHISLLHEYNDIKDAGQMLLGKLAVIRGVTTKQLYPEYDLELSD